MSTLKICYLEMKCFIEMVSYHDTFSDDKCIVLWASIAIPDYTPKSTISKGNDQHISRPFLWQISKT